MNLFLTTLIFALLITGCSQNAFTKFDLSKEQELSVSNSRTSKIVFEDKVYGIFSAAYLNKINPESFHENEYFYVYVYIKNENHLKKLALLDNIDSSMKLNGNLPIQIEELPHANKFSHLTSVNNKWNKYYLVTFKKEEALKKLNLVFKQDEFSSEILTYKKTK